MDNDSQIDLIDSRIIAHLLRDGRIPITELAEKVGLSKSPCQARVTRLRERGIITGFRATLDPTKLGRDHVAFAEVRLNSTTEKALKAFNTAARNVPEIEECHMIAGAFDYLLKVRTSDIKSYRKVLGEAISALPHVASTSTFVSMQAVKDRGV